MYLGSAFANLALPTLQRRVGAVVLPKVVGLAGMAWLLLWALVGREVAHHRCAGGWGWGWDWDSGWEIFAMGPGGLQGWQGWGWCWDGWGAKGGGVEG